MRLWEIHHVECGQVAFYYDVRPKPGPLSREHWVGLKGEAPSPPGTEIMCGACSKPVTIWSLRPGDRVDVHLPVLTCNDLFDAPCCDSCHDDEAEGYDDLWHETWLHCCCVGLRALHEQFGTYTPDEMTVRRWAWSRKRSEVG